MHSSDWNVYFRMGIMCYCTLWLLFRLNLGFSFVIIIVLIKQRYSVSNE